MMAKSVLVDGLPLGESQKDSETMMEETKEATEAAMMYVMEDDLANAK